MKTKYWKIATTILFITGFILILGIICVIQQENKIDCNSLSPIYLKASELKYASQIADEVNGFVIIPETNQIIARTEVLNCPNFNYEDYVSLG